MHLQRSVIPVTAPVTGIARLCGLALLVALLAVAGAAPARAEPPKLPALADPASPDHHVGKVVYLELVTPDLVAAERFYAEMFDWSFSNVVDGGTEYAAASHDGVPVAALVHRPIPAGQHRQPAWLSVFAVRDADAAAKAALGHGAKMLFPPHAVPDLGREAVFADPQGAVFAVLASSSGDPPDYLAAPGEWIWSSLITTDPDKAAAFYQDLFDYEVFDLSANEGGAEHLLLASDDYARASVNSLPLTGPQAHPHWLNFVRVDDADKMTAKLVTLGGHVLVAPRVDRHGGKVAVVSDPSGAAFGLMEWPATESKEAPQ